MYSLTIEKIYKEIFPDKVYLEEYEPQILEEIYEYINKSVDSKVNVVYNDIHNYRNTYGVVHILL